MKKNLLISVIFVVIGFIMILAPGCGKKDPFDAGNVTDIWVEQLILLDNHINGLEKIKTPQEAAGLISDFSAKLDIMVPKFNLILEKFPEFKKQMETQPDAKKEEAVYRLIAVGLFTDNVVNMQVQRFKKNKDLAEPLKQLVEIQKKMKLDGEPRSDSRVEEMFNKFVYGQWNDVDPRVEKFFVRLRKASLTSRLKITMTNMYILGRAIESFRAQNGYSPQVTDISQLKTYEEFIPKYIKDEKSLPMEDGWGNYLYYKAGLNKDYWIGSGGSDGKFNGFDQKGLYSEIVANDVVFFNGRFIYGPSEYLKTPAQAPASVPAPSGK